VATRYCERVIFQTKREPEYMKWEERLHGFLACNLTAEKNSKREFSYETIIAHKPREAYFRDDINIWRFLLSVKNRVYEFTCACLLLLRNNFISVVKRTQMDNEMHPLGFQRKSWCSVESFSRKRLSIAFCWLILWERYSMTKTLECAHSQTCLPKTDPIVFTIISIFYWSFSL